MEDRLCGMHRGRTNPGIVSRVAPKMAAPDPVGPIPGRLDVSVYWQKPYWTGAAAVEVLNSIFIAACPPLRRWRLRIVLIFRLGVRSLVQRNNR